MPVVTTSPAPPAAAPPAGRRVEYLPLGDVARADRNPKEHDLPAIRHSVETFGCTIAGMLDERTGRLVSGHGRLAVLELMCDEGAAPPEGVRAAPAGGGWLVPIVRGWSSRSDAEATAYLIAANRTGELGGWDDRLLAELLDETADHSPDLLAATGYSDDDLGDLIGALGAAPSLAELEEEYGEPAADDLWPVLRFKVPPEIRDEFHEITAEAGPDEVNRFLYLLTLAKGGDRA